ncbi:MAG: hypothetical protein WBA57_26135 [Elainellaceae cyanobacterium]
MARTTSVLTIGAIGIVSLMTLAGCGKAPAVNLSQSSSTPTAETSAEPTADGFDGLKTVITETKTAVESGDFTTASDAFNNFETYWQQVEDGVKDNQPDTYDAIETDMDKINGGLKVSEPNSEDVLAALQSLETSVNTAAN